MAAQGAEAQKKEQQNALEACERRQLQAADDREDSRRRALMGFYGSLRGLMEASLMKPWKCSAPVYDFVFVGLTRERLVKRKARISKPIPAKEEKKSLR
eukprot:191125-Pelagomonas_calceolata.AAC.6